MKKSIVFLCLILLLGSIANAQSFRKISKKVSSCQLKKGIRKAGKDGFNEVRLKLYSQGKLSFVDTASRVFFLESYEVESGIIYGLCWDGNNMVNYTYYQGSFSYGDSLRYTSYMVQLIENWDINTIRKEERENAIMMPGSLIYATRIITKGGGDITVSSITFRDFFKLDRDR